MRISRFALMAVAIAIITATMIGAAASRERIELITNRAGIEYTEIRERTLIGYELVYNEVITITHRCGLNETTGENQCWNETIYSRIDSTRKGQPIYTISDPVGVRYGGTEYVYDTKGCSVCASVLDVDANRTYTGKLLVCWSKVDGYRPERGEEFQCQKRSGESAEIIDLDSRQVVTRRSDVGQI